MVTGNVTKISAFTRNNQGGNPAAVVLVDQFPTDHEMTAVAAAQGYSETVFACIGNDIIKVRYFSPKGEVGFCGHATLALGYELGNQLGNGTYHLSLNDSEISVTYENGNVSLISPPTYLGNLTEKLRTRYLSMFNLAPSDLDSNIGIALANGGNYHVVIGLKSKQAVDAVTYDVKAAEPLMQADNIVTVALIHRESNQDIYLRNAFAYGGVYEDPATGAAAAAISGLLRATNQLKYENGFAKLNFFQGDAMGSPSFITTMICNEQGTPIKISGSAGYID